MAERAFSFAYGEIYQRPALDLRQRELVTISALTTLGGTEPQLEVHVNAGLNVGPKLAPWFGA